MTPGEFHNLDTHVNQWCEQNRHVSGASVIAAMMLMAAQNCIQHRISRADYLAKAADAYVKALATVQVDNPLLFDKDGNPVGSH